MSDNESYGLLLPFDVDDPEFTRGVEVGRIWALLRETDERGPFTVHATNAEMLIRIAEACDLIAVSEETTEGWLEVTFSDQREDNA